MPGMAPNSRRAARFHGSAEEEMPRELDFEAGDERPARNAGEPRRSGQTLEQMQGRPRAKGSRSGSDDLSPQMLLREDRSRPADTLLRNVSESSIGEGHGLDEAEWAELQPVGRAAAARQAARRKTAKAKKPAVKKKTAAASKPSAKRPPASARRRPR